VDRALRIRAAAEMKIPTLAAVAWSAGRTIRSVGAHGEPHHFATIPPIPILSCGLFLQHLLLSSALCCLLL
jgi:hypothetical protein